MNEEQKTAEHQKGFDVKSFTKKPKQIYRNLPKWAKFLIFALIIFIAFQCIFYVASAERLEKRLENTIWYSSVLYDNRHWAEGAAYTLAFEKGEDAEYVRWHKHGTNWKISEKERTPDWKILDDKTLVLDKDYLEYSKDWKLSGGKLYIYTGTFKGTYSKTRNW